MRNLPKCVIYMLICISILVKVTLMSNEFGMMDEWQETKEIFELI